jgi:nicotinamide-nucleotide amidase
MMYYPPHLVTKAGEILQQAKTSRIGLMMAESCTGGLISGLFTEIPGSADVVIGGVVAYCNEVKAKILTIPSELLEKHGAVSEPVARAMAEGVLKALPWEERFDKAVSIAVTGIAGPGGGSAEKPVGLVHFGAACTHAPTAHNYQIFKGSRTDVRLATVEAALIMIEEQVKKLL